MGVFTVSVFCLLIQGCEGDATQFNETTFVASNKIESFEIEATNNVIGAGEIQQYSAFATIPGQEATQDISEEVTWHSSNTSVATFTGSGLLTSHDAGTIIITATLSDLSSSTELTVSSAELNSLIISTSVQSVAVCSNTTQFTASGLFIDSTTRDLTHSVDWISEDNTIATINNEGILTALTPGNIIITAAKNTITSDPVNISIIDTLSMITLTPENDTMLGNDDQQYTATGTYNDGDDLDITATVNWVVTDTDQNETDVAIISNSTNTKGFLTTNTDTGIITIGASCNDISGTIDVSVNEAKTITELSINEGASIIQILLGSEDKQVQLIAEVTYSDDSTEIVTEDSAWFVSKVISGTSATVSSTGLVTITATGETKIKADHNDELAEIIIKVTN
ncbi:MAG: hypothetical protein ACJA0N_000512 [Pseudohongiellaceae bacterium]|jgi:hypothetical protein